MYPMWDLPLQKNLGAIFFTLLGLGVWSKLYIAIGPEKEYLKLVLKFWGLPNKFVRVKVNQDHTGSSAPRPSYRLTVCDHHAPETLPLSGKIYIGAHVCLAVVSVLSFAIISVDYARHLTVIRHCCAFECTPTVYNPAGPMIPFGRQFSHISRYVLCDCEHNCLTRSEQFRQRSVLFACTILRHWHNKIYSLRLR